jgi:hypothetical protein
MIFAYRSGRTTCILYESSRGPWIWCGAGAIGAGGIGYFTGLMTQRTLTGAGQ